MKIEDKTKSELAHEILELHRRIEQLEQSLKAAEERSEFFLEILDSLPGVITAWDSAGYPPVCQSNICKSVWFPQRGCHR